MSRALILQALMLGSMGPELSGQSVLDPPSPLADRVRRWGRACLVCKVEVDQGRKICDKGHKPTKTRRVQLPLGFRRLR